MGVGLQNVHKSRVLIVSRNYPRPAAPSLGTYVASQVRWLRKWFEVRVVSPVSLTPPLTELRRAGSWVRWLVRWRARVRQMRQVPDAYTPLWLHLPKRPFEAAEGLLFAIFLSAQRGVMSLGSWYPHLLHGHFVYPDGFAAVLLGRLLRLPVVVTAHGSDLNLLPAQNSGVRSAVCWTLRHADAVITVSEPLRRKALALGAGSEQVWVVPNGYCPVSEIEMPRAEARARLGLPQDERIVLYVGNLYPVKGVDVLVEAFARLNGLLDSTRLVVVGDGYGREDIERAVERLGLRGRVLLVGEKPHVEIPLWLRASDVVALASRSEGWPTILTEALAAGRPVVATRVGAVPDLLRSDHCGFQVDPECPFAFARALERALVRNWDEWEIRRHAPIATWKEVAQRVAEIYRRVLRR